MGGHNQNTTGAQLGRAWSIVDGDVHLPAVGAERWSAALSVLVSAIDHPKVFAAQSPDTVPAGVARDVLDQLDTLRAALDAVGLAAVPGPAGHDRAPTSVAGRDTGAGREVVISPGTELHLLVWLLHTLACAVIDPGSHRAAYDTANGHVASAWSRALSVAAGATR